VLAKFDMKLSDVDFVNLAAADGQAAFVAGRVDAIVPSDNGRFCIMSERTDTRELSRATVSRSRRVRRNRSWSSPGSTTSRRSSSG